MGLFHRCYPKPRKNTLLLPFALASLFSEILVCALKQLAGVALLDVLNNAKRIIFPEVEGGKKATAFP